MLALVLGSLGAIAATSSGHGNSGSESAHQSANNIPAAAVAYTPSVIRISNTPWMY
jgi:hypothetical protein